MHIRSVSRKAPAPAFNIQIILDIVLQFINTLEAIERFIGIDLVDRFTKDDNTPA